MILRKIGERIWVFERSFRLLGAEFGNRMTVVKLGGNDLFVHSPVKLDVELKNQMESLGRAAYIVTPNAFHGLFIEQWLAAFPGATHFTAKADDKNRGSQSIDLSDSSAAKFLLDIEIVRLLGIPKLNEFAFFHKPSRTLILTDLAFNIGKEGAWWTKLFFSLNDAYGKFGQSRLMRSMIKDKAALQNSLEKVYHWDFDRIVVSHGDIVETGGKEIMRRAFQ